jgi:N-acetyl-gamma-glutamylphosphate reductase
MRMSKRLWGVYFFHKPAMIACIVGYTGIVGKKLLLQLLESESITAVSCIGRRKADEQLSLLPNANKITIHQVDFDNPRHRRTALVSL